MDHLFSDLSINAGISAAWHDSQANDPEHRHEEGGYIIRLPDGTLSIARWPRGQTEQIIPPTLEPGNCYNGEIVIAAFHTHPSPPIDERGNEWDQEPSTADRRWHARRNLPGYVISRDAVYLLDANGGVTILGKREEVLLP